MAPRPRPYILAGDAPSERSHVQYDRHRVTML